MREEHSSALHGCFLYTFLHIRPRTSFKVRSGHRAFKCLALVDELSRCRPPAQNFNLVRLNLPLFVIIYLFFSPDRNARSRPPQSSQRLFGSTLAEDDARTGPSPSLKHPSGNENVASINTSVAEISFPLDCTNRTDPANMRSSGCGRQ